MARPRPGIAGRTEAIHHLTAALDEHNPEFVRAECGLRTDLAHALHAVGERAETREHALIAKQLAVQIGSERNRRRVTPLTRPLWPAAWAAQSSPTREPEPAISPRLINAGTSAQRSRDGAPGDR
jgi:hypothetical protein